jgi:drug/metabolite transporter (DMT)-like permease
VSSHRHLPLLPAAAFVLVWSSGYIAGPYGVEAMSPLMLVAVRFVLAAVLAWALARALRGKLRVTRADAIRIGISGFVLNGVQFGAMYLAFDAGLGATLASLMHSLSPVLTALLAAAFLGERLSPLQVVGFVVGVAGVMLVLGPDVDEAGGVLGIVCGVISVFGLSVGTLGQRWIGHAPDPLWSATIQFGVAAPPLLVLALVTEGTDVVRDPKAAAISLVYLAVVNSIIGLGLLGILVRARGAGAAASVFFLMPPVTAVLAWLLLGETLDLREIAGLVITVLGVAAATRARVPEDFEPVAPEPQPEPAPDPD